MKNHIPGKASTFINILVFSFLLSGCYTAQHYSDTPQNIISGNSKIEPGEEYKIDSIHLKSNSNLNLSSYFTKFIDCKADSCGKFIYRYGYSELKTKTDTVEVSNISRIYYNKKEFSWGWAAFYAILAAGAILIFAPVFLKDIFKT